jgi:hypothetical protein
VFDQLGASPGFVVVVPKIEILSLVVPSTETHLAQKLGEKLGLAFAEHSQNTLIKQVHNSTIQNGFKTIIGHFRNSHARPRE